MSTMNSYFLQVNRLSHLTVIGMFIALIGAGCSSEDFDAAGFEAGSDTGFAAGSDAEVAVESVAGGDTGPDSAGSEPPNVPTSHTDMGQGSSCTYLASLDRDSMVSVCLDEVIMMPETGSAWCELEEPITSVLHNKIIELKALDDYRVLGLSETTCEDHDNDCYYTCTHWQLPDLLLDPDPRRTSVTGVERIIDLSTMRENETGEIVPDSDSNYICSDGSSMELLIEHTPCVINLGSVRVGKLWSCENNTIAWIENSMESSTLLLKELGATSMPDSINVDINLETLSCLYSSTKNVIIASDGTSVYQVFRSMFRPESGVLDGAPLEISQVKMNTDRLQWWSLKRLESQDTNGVDDAQQYLGVVVGGRAVELWPLPAIVKSVELTCTSDECSENDRRVAYLTENNEVRLTSWPSETLSLEANVLSSETNEGRSFFDRYGPFKSIQSSNYLLGMVQGTNFDNLSTNTILFSLWAVSNDEGSLSNFPLSFDATQRGYLSVELVDIKGMNALLRLNDEDELGAKKEIWAVYNPLTEQLTLIDEVMSEIIVVRSDTNMGPRWVSAPVLGDRWVSRLLVEDDESKVATFKLDQ